MAETGNLLLLRPPRNEGRDTWMRRAWHAAIGRRIWRSV